MRARSLKRQREDAALDDRPEFRALFIGAFCWLCRDKVGSQVHHIASRSHELRHHRCNLFWTCDGCHEHILPVMGVPAVFRFKQLRDPDGFDKTVAATLLRAKTGRVDL